MLMGGNAADLNMPTLGNNMPVMGISTSPLTSAKASGADDAAVSLSDALFTSTQQRVLGQLFASATRSYSVSELIQSTGAGSGAVQRELARLTQSGLLEVALVGRQKRYSANPDSPIFAELSAIVRKTFGLAAPLREALQPLAEQLRAAFVYGSIAKGTDTARSDIDLLLLSDSLTYADAMRVLHPAMQQLGRDINPTVYDRSTWDTRLREGNSFVTRVLAQPRIWVMGGEHELTA